MTQKFLGACPTKHLDGVDLSTLPSKLKTVGIFVSATTSHSLNPTKAKQFEDAFDVCKLDKSVTTSLKTTTFGKRL